MHGAGLWYCGPLVYGPAVYPAPGAYPAMSGYHAGGMYPMTVPHELAADGTTSPQEALVGGHRDVRLSIEYLVESGAPAPAITVSVTSNGSTSTWEETSIGTGYHVSEGFLTVKAGSKVRLEVTDAVARVRWCETICC
ncbi:MAG TPA: hypothetical protein VLT62_29670 [Candidatus Methylomirabilis sp.]|nr:hypothetical protein [Candidatus Methylomirabilis sp.]